jgi:hypothetical protein
MMMRKWYRVRQAGLVILAGGMLLQTAAGCQELLAPLLTSLLSSLVVNALVGGLAT